MIAMRMVSRDDKGRRVWLLDGKSGAMTTDEVEAGLFNTEQPLKWSKKGLQALSKTVRKNMRAELVQIDWDDPARIIVLS